MKWNFTVGSPLYNIKPCMYTRLLLCQTAYWTISKPVLPSNPTDTLSKAPILWFWISLNLCSYAFLILSVQMVCIYTLLQVCVCYCFPLSSLMLFLLSWLILWLLSIDVLLLVINYGGGGLLRWLSGFQPALHRYPTIIIIRKLVFIWWVDFE